MSVRVTVSSKRPTVFELEDQMRELRALRRALCLLNAARDRPKGSRRRLYRASVRSRCAHLIPSPAKKWTDVSPRGYR